MMARHNVVIINITSVFENAIQHSWLFFRHNFKHTTVNVCFCHDIVFLFILLRPFTASSSALAIFFFFWSKFIPLKCMCYLLLVVNWLLLHSNGICFTVYWSFFWFFFLSFSVCSFIWGLLVNMYMQMFMYVRWVIFFFGISSHAVGFFKRILLLNCLFLFLFLFYSTQFAPLWQYSRAICFQFTIKYKRYKCEHIVNSRHKDESRFRFCSPFKNLSKIFTSLVWDESQTIQ